MARAKKPNWPQYILKPLRHLRPPEKITVSQWAERNRRLDSKTSSIPGRWSNAVTPYLVGIMDAFSTPAVEEIVFVKPTQVGGTEVIHNILGYCITDDPGPTLIVYPTDPLAESVSKNRIQPMMRSTPVTRALFHETDSNLMELQFDSMTINLTGANSPVGLSSHPRRYVFMDEVDKYPAASKREAAPIKLARERTRSYDNRKIFITSTPTLETGNVWQAMEDADVRYHYFVPCPHCGEMIELRFPQILYAEDKSLSAAERAETAAYFCQVCKAMIVDADKPGMLKKGQWRAVRGSEKRAIKVAFWLNSLYSPFTTWSAIAREFLSSKDDPNSLQNFVNSWLAEPWKDLRTSTSTDMLLKRQTVSPRWEVPEWTQLLTGGVDVQEHSLYWTIRAWGPGMTSQNVAHGQCFSLAVIRSVMNMEYRKANGEPWLVQLCGVDSGDQTDTVYEFCTANEEWAVAVKGSSKSLGLNHFRLSEIDRTKSVAHGHPLLMVDGDKYKTIISSRIKRENGEGSWMVHAECDLEYTKQVTSEHRNATKSGTLKWETKTSHADNHYLDAEVYAFAVADYLGLRTLGMGEPDEAAARSTPSSPMQEEQKKQWIGGGDLWLR